ncbi:Putative ribonuclease H protein At1g65750 [Linum grandiflorum]
MGIAGKVGRGTEIRVWRDPWVRRDGNMKVKTPYPISDWDLRVSALIQPTGDDWDEVRVRSLFHEREAEEILAMPVCGEVADEIVWHHSRHDDYTVRSAYRLLIDRCVSMEGMQVAGPWKMLWNLKLPPKIKHLVWRVLRNLLPTRQNLRAQHVSIPSHCGTCSKAFESTWHLFVECEMARDYWEAAGGRLGSRAFGVSILTRCTYLSIRGC